MPAGLTAPDDEHIFSAMNRHSPPPLTPRTNPSPGAAALADAATPGDEPSTAHLPTLHDRLIAERRLEIIEAATNAFARHGVAGATMQEIAAEVGLTAGALYRYFPSKNDLLQTILDQCREQHVALLTQAASNVDASPLGALTELARAAWQDFEHPHAATRLAVQLEATLAAARSPELGEPLRAVHREILAQLTEIVRAAQGSNEIDRSVDAAALATVLLAAHHGLQQLTVLIEEEAQPRAALQALLALVTGLTPRADQAGRTE